MAKTFATQKQGKEDQWISLAIAEIAEIAGIAQKSQRFRCTKPIEVLGEVACPACLLFKSQPIDVPLLSCCQGHTPQTEPLRCHRHLQEGMTIQDQAQPRLENYSCMAHYHGVGNLYLINSKKLQIGIGIGKFAIINSEELHIGTFLGDGALKGDRNRYR